MMTSRETKNDAQAVIYRTNPETGDFEYLILFRYDQFTGEDQWRLVKGGINDGEVPSEAALREAKEETGLTALFSAITIRDYSYEAFDVRHNVISCLVNAENTHDEDVYPDSREEGGSIIRHAEWVDADTALSHLLFEDERLAVQYGHDYLKNVGVRD